MFAEISGIFLVGGVATTVAAAWNGTHLARRSSRRRLIGVRRELARMRREQISTLLRPLEQDAGYTRQIAKDLWRDLCLSAALTPATGPNARGDKANPGGE